MARILIIDDDPTVPLALQAVLKKAGHEIEVAADADEGLSRAEHGDFEVVITDLHWEVPGTKRLEPKGLNLIQRLREKRPHLPVILITAFPATDTTIVGTKLGARDYITKPKPTNEQELEDLLKAVHDAAQLTHGPVALPDDISSAEKTIGSIIVGQIVGQSRAMQDVYKEIGRVADKPVTVLIRGETGTGKELVARTLYQYSGRHDQPFIVVHCAAIPENLLESELFGHEAGAFTDAKVRRIGRFELANHGTLFLDEIGDMSLVTQVKLLRVLQDRKFQRVGGKETIEVDVRIIAATHKDLESAIQEKVFREDLYYRLNDVVIRLPPLRERKEDIPDLVKYFMQRHGSQLGSTKSTIKPTITPEALAHLEQQSWPGNVRELENVVRKVLLLAGPFTISDDMVAKVLAGSTPPRPVANQTFAAYVAELLAKAQRGEYENVQATITEVAERELYAQAIRLAGGDQTKAAGWLGVSRPTMREKLTRYGLHPGKDAA